MSTLELDSQRARAAFSGLDSCHVFADNARESQVLTAVADIVHSSLVSDSHSNQSKCLTPTVVSHGSEAAAVIFNASSTEEVAFGVSSTQLLASLAGAIRPLLHAGDEIIVTGEHQANVSPWRDVASTYNPPLPIHIWKPTAVESTNSYALSYNSAFSSLAELLSSRTRVVAIPGCSNILGELLNLKDAVYTIRTLCPHALIVVDLAAFAPHRCIDVRAWDVDFAVFSFHKLYGPQAAALYARKTSPGASIRSISLSFNVSLNGLMLEVPSAEQISAANFVLSYLISLSTSDTPTTRDSQRMALERTSKLLEAYETKLAEILLTFLTSDRARARGVRIVGPEDAGPTRVPIVSFIVLDGDKGESALRSRDIVARVDVLGTIHIRFMQFNPHSVMATVPDLNTSTGSWCDDGVVRVSLVHYNTAEEVKRIVHAFEEILFE